MLAGNRVKFAAWTDAFMRGECYGSVVQVTTSVVKVRGERSGKMFRFALPMGDANPALERV